MKKAAFFCFAFLFFFDTLIPITDGCYRQFHNLHDVSFFLNEFKNMENLCTIFMICFLIMRNAFHTLI